MKKHGMDCNFLQNKFYNNKKCLIDKNFPLKFFFFSYYENENLFFNLTKKREKL